MASFEDFYNDIAEDIKANFGTKKGSYPTKEWVAGVFKRFNKMKEIENALANPSLQETYRVLFEKIKYVRDYGIAHGLVTENNSVTEAGKKFLQYLNQTMSEKKKFDAHRTPTGISPERKQLWYNFLSAVTDSDKEWAASLSSDNQELLKKYTELTPKSFNFLKGIFNKKISKEKYTDYINHIMDSDPDTYELLSSLNFINGDRLNFSEVNNFFNFIGKYGYSHLKLFNRELSWTTDRIAADKALAQNYADRQFSGSERANKLGNSVRDFIDSLSTDQRNILQKLFSENKIKKSSKEFLISNNIINNENKYTDFGKLVKYNFSHYNAEPPYDLFKNEKMRGLEKQEDNPDINTRYFNNRSQRRNEIAQGRSRSFKNYLNR